MYTKIVLGFCILCVFLVGFREHQENKLKEHVVNIELKDKKGEDVYGTTVVLENSQVKIPESEKVFKNQILVSNKFTYKVLGRKGSYVSVEGVASNKDGSTLFGKEAVKLSGESNSVLHMHYNNSEGIAGKVLDYKGTGVAGVGVLVVVESQKNVMSQDTSPDGSFLFDRVGSQNQLLEVLVILYGKIVYREKLKAGTYLNNIFLNKKLEIRKLPHEQLP